MILEGVAAGAGSLAILVAVFVPLERLFPARRTQRVLRPGLGLDAIFFFGQYVVWNGVVFAVLSFVERIVHAHVAFALSWPTALRAIVAVAFGDLLVYGFHRACHAWTPLWRIHAVHHTSEHLDFLAAHREHPLDGIATSLAQNLPAFALGVRLDVLAGLVAFRAIWAIFVHSNARLPLGPFRCLVGAPELHHWHHARLRETKHNFANLAPWVDVLFGTHHCPEATPGEERFPLGVDEPAPRGYVALLAWPFRRRSRPG
jgi:sterol desaturase/sphingolipid hydroxylase (fatty acid hydroxylase superfamily)